MEDKLWTNEEMKELEEAYQGKKSAKTGVGCDGFHPKVPLDLTRENKKRNSGVIGKGGAEWQMAATSLHNDVLLDTQEC